MAHALQHCMKWLLCSRNTTPKHRVPAPGMPWFLSDEFNIPFLNAFCRKRKKYFKKKKETEAKQKGEYPSANLPKWRFSFFYFYSFKSNIKFSSANLLLTTRKKKIDNLSGDLICLQKKQFHGADFAGLATGSLSGFQ